MRNRIGSGSSLIRNWQPTLHNQLHGAFDGDADGSGLAVDEAIVLEQKVLARVQVGRGLVAVVDVQPRLGEARGDLLQLLLRDLRIADQVPALAAGLRRAGCNRPLAGGAVLLLPLCVDGAAHVEAEKEKDDERTGEAAEEDNHAADVGVRSLVARMAGIPRPCMSRIACRVLACVVAVSMHVQAPEALPDADRLC